MDRERLSYTRLHDVQPLEIFIIYPFSLADHVAAGKG